MDFHEQSIDTLLNSNGFRRRTSEGDGNCIFSAVKEAMLNFETGVLGSIPGLATYFRFSFRFFKKGSCQLLAKVCARNTG